MKLESTLLMRGAQRKGTSIELNCRITPAHAGSTKFLQNINEMDRDHPCSRGEHCFLSQALNFKLGSPPLTRGALKLTPKHPLFLRITPAYAGSTYLYQKMLIKERDHSCLHGEYTIILQIFLKIPGSPLLTRGVRKFFYK